MTSPKDGAQCSLPETVLKLPRNEENRRNAKTFVIETLIFDFGPICGDKYSTEKFS